MVPAKKFGVKVHPVLRRLRQDRLVPSRVGDTEYGVKMIPMGGFIRMLGMLPPALRKRGASDGELWARLQLRFVGVFGKMIADARAVGVRARP